MAPRLTQAAAVARIGRTHAETYAETRRQALGVRTASVVEAPPAIRLEP